MELLRSCIYFFSILCCPILLSAQNLPISAPQDTTKKIRIEASELGEYFVEHGVEKQKLSGHVRLNNEGTLIFCDTAVIANDFATLVGNVTIVESDTTALYGDSVTYDAVTRKAVLYGNATLKDGSQQLFTEKLYYDLNTKIASYHTGALLTNGKSQLKSKHGYYHTNEKNIFFKGDVVLTDPEFTLRTDTMQFNTETKIATFLAPTLMSQPDSKIYTESGFYDTANNRAEFNGNPQFIKKEQKGYAKRMLYEGLNKEFLLLGDAHIDENDKIVRADSIFYSDQTGQSILRGNATYRDSTQDIASEYIKYDSRTKSYSIQGRAKVKNGSSQVDADQIDYNEELGSALAVGSVIYHDTASNYTILAGRLDYNKKTDYSYASGGYGGYSRPMFKTVMDNDTLYMSADTLTTFKPNLEDSVRVLVAHRDVRIFKSDLQASADSLSYSSADSTFVFYNLGLQPFMWSDTTQFSADTIALQMRDGKLHQLKLQKNSLVMSAKEGQLYDQIKGRNCTAYFQEQKVSLMQVDGNAQAVYYAQNDSKAYIGVNESKCSSMRIEFDEGQVAGIRFYKKPEGTFTPMNKSEKGGVKLEGFNVETKRRPVNIAGLFTPK
jgi:lipopolysaccharide export system protein LptA